MIEKCILLSSLFLVIGCVDNKKQTINSFENTKDTIDYDLILNELNNEFDSSGSHPVKLKYFDKNDKAISGLRSGDTFHLKVLYSSKRFLRLNSSQQIYLEPITDNLKIVRRLDKNKFEVYIKPDSDTLIFDIYLGSNKFIFKSSHIDEKKHIYYENLRVIGLCQKIEIVR